jgi:hypothetical protein
VEIDTQIWCIFSIGEGDVGVEIVKAVMIRMGTERRTKKDSSHQSMIPKDHYQKKGLAY